MSTGTGCAISTFAWRGRMPSEAEPPITRVGVITKRSVGPVVRVTPVVG
ncbi:hypothetical protein [Embleya sp. AB8]